MISEMNEYAASIGRTDPIEVMYRVYDDNLPGLKQWNADRFIENVRAQSEIGVTWQDVRSTPFGLLPLKCSI